MSTTTASSLDVRAHLPDETMPASSAAIGQPAPTADVGPVSRDEDVDRELRIVQLGESFKAAYGMFEATGNLAHRDEAYRLLRLQEQAIKARSPQVQAARHAAFERQLDQGLGFFSGAAAQNLKTGGGRTGV